MSSGATKSWRELLEMATGETKLSAKPILEFYEPLYTWLKDFNANNDINVGWDITESKSIKAFINSSLQLVLMQFHTRP